MDNLHRTTSYSVPDASLIDDRPFGFQLLPLTLSSDRNAIWASHTGKRADSD